MRMFVLVETTVYHFPIFSSNELTGNNFSPAGIIYFFIQV